MKKLLYMQSVDFQNIKKLAPSAICDIYAIGVADI